MKTLRRALGKVGRRAWLALGALVLVGAAVWALAGSPGPWGGDGDSTAQAELAPLPWASDPGGQRPEAYSAKTAEIYANSAAAPVDPKTGLPAASAGSNGSYTPPPPGERKRMNAQLHAYGGAGSGERTALLINGTVLAPPGAPDPIRGAINAANQLVGQPYVWGGGHSSWRSRGYDCSGAVSYALAGGGLIGAPATSGQLMSWGEPGPGQWLTIYANPGHVYAVIAGLRWDTVGDANGSGPRWHPVDPYPQGFAVRHLPGL